MKHTTLPLLSRTPRGTLIKHICTIRVFDNQFAIQQACRSGSTELMHKILAIPFVDPTFNHSAPLRFAVDNERIVVVEMLLLDKRADPTALNSYSLRVAAKYGKDRVVSLLLDDGRADPSALQSYAFRRAAIRARGCGSNVST
jgi:ankyrin repeat protein